MIDWLPFPLRQILDWLRRRFFREEDWSVAGPAATGDFVQAIEAVSNRGRPLLMTLPKFGFNKAFVGLIRDRRIVIKHRTLAVIWPIGPGSYYFSGRIADDPGGGIVVAGRYQLRPILAIMYYAYLLMGFGFLGVSLLAILAGAGAWVASPIGPVVLISGLKMLGITSGYLALGWLHITLEKWLDGRNRRAVRALLQRAAG